MDVSGTSDAEIIRWANETRLSAIVLAVEAQRLEVLLERLTALDIPLIDTVPTSDNVKLPSSALLWHVGMPRPAHLGRLAQALGAAQLNARYQAANGTAMAR